MAVHVVVGGQYGSEGKGAFAGDLARRIGRGGRIAAIRVGGPNAGHTVIDDQGREWKLRQVPVAAVTRPDADLMIAAGGEIDLEVLDYEIDMLDAAGFEVSQRLTVDLEATIISKWDQAAEQGTDAVGIVQRIGSTGKGIGAARAARIWRNAELYGANRRCAGGTLYRLEVGDYLDVLIEGTQGYALGLHAGWYPYCTSRDCRAIDFLAEVGISPWSPNYGPTKVWVVFRPYPIRVAGNSGPMWQELDWDTLARRHGAHIEPERTTVTQKIRRVGSWDARLAASAMRENGGPSRWVNAVMMMADYVVPTMRGATSYTDLDPATKGQLGDYISLWSQVTGPIAAFGTGPASVTWIDRP